MNLSKRDAAARSLFSLGLYEDGCEIEPGGSGLLEELDASAQTPPCAEPPIGEQAGDRIGRYELLRPLGEGGFGTVWLVRQREPIRREVALKLLKPGMDSREIIARFRAEQQSLALMTHPHIAAVLDAGATEGGRLYFVMERIDGPPLTEYCDQKRLGIEERLGLFLQVCDAVQHAHRKGVIHRDLKPSNLLVGEVDGRPVPKVIDFGIAKALHPEGGALAPGPTRTAEGFIVGTPQYMSPEQAGSARDIDVRGDVYSLGAVLHELLTGEPPIRAEEVAATGGDSVLRRIREEEVAKPSSRVQLLSRARDSERADRSDRGETRDRSSEAAASRGATVLQLSRKLQGELDWIVLRALEKERERRYQSVGGLAADLRRHLAGEAVAAGPPSGWYRFRKLVRRNRGPFSGIAAAAAALVIGLVLASWQAIRATTAELIAESRLEMAEQARDAAERMLAESIQSVRRGVAAGQSGSITESIDGAARYLETLPPELENRATASFRISVGLSAVASAAFEGRLEETREHLESLISLVETLEENEALNEREETDFGTALMLGAHVFGEAREYEVSTDYRRIVRERGEAWLRREPGALWALAALGHEAGAAALEAAFMSRKPQAALPHVARMKLLELRLARAAPGSVEHMQIRGLGLFCEAFAAHHLGRPQATVIKLFENAAAAFRIAYERDDGSPYREVFIRDFQLGAETAAGIRLIALGVAEPDPAKVERGRNLILDAYGQRLELALADPRRLEWWKDLAGSCKQLIKVATHSESPEEAEKLIAMALETTRLFPEHALVHHPTAQALSEALLDTLRLQRARWRGWSPEQEETLLLAFEGWFHNARGFPGAYALQKRLDYLMDHALSALAAGDTAGGGSATDLRRGLEHLRQRLASAAAEQAANAALPCAEARLKLLLRDWSDSGEEEEARHLKWFDDVAELAWRLHRGGVGPEEFLASLLAGAGEEVRRWLASQPSTRRRPLAEAVRARFDPLAEALDDAAKGRSGETIPQMQAWGAWRVVAAAEDWIDDAASDRAHRRLVEVHQAAADAATDPGDRQLIFNTILGPHWRAIELWGRRQWERGDEDGALFAFEDLVATRMRQGLGQSPYHFATLALNEARRAYLLASLGRESECPARIAAARASIRAIQRGGDDAERGEILALALDLLEVSFSPAPRPEGGGAATELAALVSKQRALHDPEFSTYARHLVDLGWGRYAGARLDALAPAEREALKLARQGARDALLEARPTLAMRDALAPLPPASSTGSD